MFFYCFIIPFSKFIIDSIIKSNKLIITFYLNIICRFFRIHLLPSQITYSIKIISQSALFCNLKNYDYIFNLANYKQGSEAYKVRKTKTKNQCFPPYKKAPLSKRSCVTYSKSRAAFLSRLQTPWAAQPTCSCSCRARTRAGI